MSGEAHLKGSSPSDLPVDMLGIPRSPGGRARASGWTRPSASRAVLAGVRPAGVRPGRRAVPEGAAMPVPPIRPIAICVLLTLPALVVRFTGVPTPAPVGLALFGTAVVAASFLLAWAAEAARVDISGPLAIALLAVIAVLPEYAVDLYFAYTAGHEPDYVQYAAANMTGSNRLLLGLGWPVVVLTALWVASRRSGRGVRELVLESGYRMELGFLLIASIVGFVAPITGVVNLILGFALL